MLVNRLPATSATAKALDASGAAAWSLDQHLAAIVADRLDRLIYVTTVIATDETKRGLIDKPQPIERPGMPDPPGRIRFGGRHGSAQLRRHHDLIGGQP